jgi:hypothetical protein
VYPLLSLSQISIDPELARRLSRRFAYYHLILPIAQDDDKITVAMAHPDNQRVVEVISAAMGTAITPVRSRPDDIRRLLDAVWDYEGELGQSGVMYWTAHADRWLTIQQYVEGIAGALSIELLANPHEQTFDQFVELVQQQRPVMTICEVSDIDSFARLIAGPPTSILITRRTFSAPRDILHVLRGHTPDKHVLDWVIPIAQYYEAEITLLAAATALHAHQGNPLISDFARLILPEHPAQMIEYGRMLASMNLRGRMRVGDRGLENAFSDTFASANYDLVAIAIENDGKFVKRLWQQFSDYPIAYLIVKP